jgi:HSP20 family protein
MARGPYEWEEDIHRLGEQVDDFFDRFIGFASAPRYLFQHTWRPAVDVYEEEDSIVVVAELPGVVEADLQVTVHHGRLRIAGVRRLPHIEGCKHPLQLEIQHGPFARHIVLPADVDADHITASAKNGLLVVTLPIARPGRPVKVNVTQENEP